MSRTYSRRTCWICKQSVSASGAAWVSHCRKHVREGKLKEVQYIDKKLNVHIDFENVKKV